MGSSAEFQPEDQSVFLSYGFADGLTRQVHRASRRLKVLVSLKARCQSRSIHALKSTPLAVDRVGEHRVVRRQLKPVMSDFSRCRAVPKSNSDGWIELLSRRPIAKDSGFVPAHATLLPTRNEPLVNRGLAWKWLRLAHPTENGQRVGGIVAIGRCCRR